MIVLEESCSIALLPGTDDELTTPADGTRESASNGTRESASNRRQLLLALGPHRSGTSLVTRCLNSAGYAVGDDLIEANRGNPDGYWEDRYVIAINDAILDRRGRRWRDPRPADFHREDAEGVAQATARLEAMFDGSPRLVIKDPRLCLTAPIWFRAAHQLDIDMRALVVLRRPADAALSLVDRDGELYSDALLLWIRYVTAAIRQCESFPHTYLRYEALCADPVSEIQRALSDLEQSTSFDVTTLASLARPPRPRPAVDHPLLRPATSLYTARSPYQVVVRIERQFELQFENFADFIDATVERRQRMRDIEVAEETARAINAAAAELSARSLAAGKDRGSRDENRVGPPVPSTHRNKRRTFINLRPGTDST